MTRKVNKVQKKGVIVKSPVGELTSHDIPSILRSAAISGLAVGGIAFIEYLMKVDFGENTAFITGFLAFLLGVFNRLIKESK